MEPEISNERVKREAQRVAAAFGVNEWDAIQYDDGWEFIGIGRGETLVAWAIESSTGLWLGGEVGPKEVRVCDRRIWRSHHSSCQFARNSHDLQEWLLEKCLFCPLFNELMARGLYALGLEIEEVLDQLPQLSSHEKIELRLSMPREFWPQTWLKEEAIEREKHDVWAAYQGELANKKADRL